MPAATTTRVEQTTPSALNRHIKERMEESVRYHAAHPERIPDRLHALNTEWDIERTLAANAASLALAGTLLGAFANRRWLVLPAVVTGFLLQHTIHGWCPPALLFRWLGVRTAMEIDRERYALQALRGDFRAVQSGTDAGRAEAALRAVNT